MLADALEHLVRGLVSNPDDVRVKDRDMRRGRMLEVRVNPEDIGKVIGRQGRTAQALRTVMGALAGREQVRIDFVDVDRPRRVSKHS
ncbi:MAG: RNA-binding protein [Propionibacteriaceae bacterium]